MVKNIFCVLVALMVRCTDGQPTTSCNHQFQETCADIRVAQQILTKLDAAAAGCCERCTAQNENAANQKSLAGVVEEYQSLITTKLDVLKTAVDVLQSVGNETRSRGDESSEASRSFISAKLDELTAATNELRSSNNDTMTILSAYKAAAASDDTNARLNELSIASEASASLMNANLEALTTITEELRSSNSNTMTKLTALETAIDKSRSADNETRSRVDELSTTSEASLTAILAKLDALTSKFEESRSGVNEKSTKLDSYIEDSRSGRNETKAQLDGLSASSRESHAVIRNRLDALSMALGVSDSNQRQMTERLDEIEKALNLTQASLRQRPSLAACDINGIFLETDTHQYKFVQDEVTWYEARDLCHRCGFRLMQYQPTGERQTILQWLQRLRVTASAYVWMDGTDEGHEGCWVWTYPSPTPFTSGLTNWRSGEPSNSLGHENCVHFYVENDLKWNDIECSREMPYLCQRSVRASTLEALPLPTTDEITAASCN